MEEIAQIFKDKSVSYTEKYELPRSWYGTVITKMTKEHNGYGYVYRLSCRGLVRGNKNSSIYWEFDEEDKSYCLVGNEFILDMHIEFESVHSYSKTLEDLLSRMLIEISPKTREVEIDGTWLAVFWATPTLTVERNGDEVNYSINLTRFKTKNVNCVLTEEQLEELERRKEEGNRSMKFLY